MHTVTAITEQRRRKSRVSVFLDDEFWCGMSRLCQIELQLVEGRSLDAQAKSKAEEHIAENDALGYCIEVLSYRPRTSHHLTVKLEAKEYAPEVIQATLRRCEELLLLNDEQYARDLAAGRRDSGQGRRRVAEKLKNDGIERDLADEILDETFIPEEESGQAEMALLRKFRPPLARDEQRKATGYLLRRGFGSSATREAISLAAGDADQERATGPDEETAVELVRRKYPRLDPRDPREVRKVQGFLVRRGCSFDVARNALATLRDET